MQRLESEMRQTKKTIKEHWHICSGTERHATAKIALPLPLFSSSSLLCYSVSRRYSPGSGVADFLSFSDSAILWQCLCVCVCVVLEVVY